MKDICEKAIDVCRKTIDYTKKLDSEYEEKIFPKIAFESFYFGNLSGKGRIALKKENPEFSERIAGLIKKGIKIYLENDCEKCETKNAKDAKFCKNCGEKLK